MSRIPAGRSLSGHVQTLLREHIERNTQPGASQTTRGTFITPRRRGRGGSGGSSRTMAFSIASLSSSTLQVTVRGGPVLGFNGYVSCSQAVVSVGGTQAAPHYVYVQGTINPLTAVIGSVSVATFPVHDSQYWRRPLFQVYVSDAGSIVIPAGGVYWQGVIDLKSWYGP